MAYSKTNWENSPSTNTPLNASNLNKIENELKFLDDSLEETVEQIGTGIIDSNLQIITITGIDLLEYKAITVQFGSHFSNEGDSAIFLIDRNGTVVNDIVHIDMYATDTFYCKGFAKLTNETEGGVLTILPRQLVGWSSINVTVNGLKRYVNNPNISSL